MTTIGTFRPKNNIIEGTKQYQLRRFAEATLGSGSLKEAVKLPLGENLEEWLAVHTVDFCNHLNMLYSTIKDFCTPSECPIMRAGDQYEYLWHDPDSNRFLRPTSLPARDYIQNLLNWVRKYTDDEAIFPLKAGITFPRGFRNLISQMFRRLFRVYAHIYCHHFRVISAIGVEAHLNTSFKHFILFSNEFGLIDAKEYAPIRGLIEGVLAV